MKEYRVIYLEGSYLKNKSNYHAKGHLDGIETANDLEALILEQCGEGYELFCITPISGMVSLGLSMPPTTTGFIVTVKREN
jgi:hypothetical protein